MFLFSLQLSHPVEIREQGPEANECLLGGKHGYWGQGGDRVQKASAGDSPCWPFPKVGIFHDALPSFFKAFSCFAFLPF